MFRKANRRCDAGAGARLRHVCRPLMHVYRPLMHVYRPLMHVSGEGSVGGARGACRVRWTSLGEVTRCALNAVTGQVLAHTLTHVCYYHYSCYCYGRVSGVLSASLPLLAQEDP